jgi:hypothetical protein
MKLGRQVVELRHAPRWQLTLAGRPVKPFALWHGSARNRPNRRSKKLKRTLPPNTFEELVSAAPKFPTWLAQSVGKVAYG